MKLISRKLLYILSAVFIICGMLLVMPGPLYADPTLVSITVTPAAQTKNVGDKLDYTATGNYSDFSTNDITHSVTWESTVTTVATINASNGKAEAISIGSTTIKATLGLVSGETSLNVEAALPSGGPLDGPVTLKSEHIGDACSDFGHEARLLMLQ